MSAESEAKITMYRSSYQRASVDSRNEVAIQSEQRLYTPGQEVRIQGAIWSDLVTQISTSAGSASVSVNVKVTDDEGNVVAERNIQVNNSGESNSDNDNDGGEEYSLSFTLPADAEPGTYTVVSTINVEVDVLDRIINANIGANIGGVGGGGADSGAADINVQTTSTSIFAVSRPVVFTARAEGDEKEFEVNVASNSSTVKNFAFNQADKKISFVVEGETGTKGVAQVTIPKELLSGQLVVSIDGRAIAEDSNDVIITSDTTSEMTLEINYPHSEHTIEITGTSVVPEFPVSMLVMAAALGSIIVALVVMKSRSTWFNSNNSSSSRRPTVV